jgi:prevent-host-death family protein
MRMITAHEAEAQFGTFITSVAHEPVTVIQDGAPAAVLLSIEDYERLKGNAKALLKYTLIRTRSHAAAQGLTEAELDRLLADES